MSSVNSTASRKQGGPIVISENMISNIYTFLETIGIPEIKIQCVDSVHHEFSDLNGLLSYQNSKSSRISVLEMRASGEKRYANLEIDLDDRFGGIRYYIKFPTKEIYGAQKKIEHIIEGSRPWYWPMSKINFYIMGILIYFFVLVLSFVLVVFEFIPVHSDGKEDLKSQALASLVSVIYFGILFFLDYLNSFLFKKNFLLIGQQKQHYEFLNNIRWAVIVPIAIGLVTGAFFYYLS